VVVVDSRCDACALAASLPSLRADGTDALDVGRLLEIPAMTLRAHRTRAWYEGYDRAAEQARQAKRRRFFARRRAHFATRTRQEMREGERA
jgi:hypothetical protein